MAVEKENIFTGTIAAPALVRNFCDTDVYTRSVYGRVTF